jgi:hypothetical protein
MQIVFSHGGTDLIKSWKNNFSMATNVFDQDRKRWKFWAFLRLQIRNGSRTVSMAISISNK